MLAEAHGKYIVMLMGVPNGTECPVIVPAPVVEGENGVRVYDTYRQASEVRAAFKAKYPLYWYGIAKVNIPKEQR